MESNSGILPSQRHTWNPYSSASPYQTFPPSLSAQGSSPTAAQQSPLNSPATTPQAVPGSKNPILGGAGASSSMATSSPPHNPHPQHLSREERAGASSANQQDQLSTSHDHQPQAEITEVRQGKKRNWLLRGLTKAKEGLKTGVKKFNENLIFASGDGFPYPGKERIRRWKLRREGRNRRG
ncbi:hypothetical protein N431DRAFT_453915 [Stipitochalara longipes BDJ]|nr:hypothetical protein N431DRAFT_453915 [Stipitochalara longipes BDJ]